MARIGLNNFRYSILKEEGGKATYSGAKKPAKAVSCKVSVSTASASLYADDVIAESDTAFTGGTVTIGIDEDDNQTQADLLGHTIASEGGELVRNANDVAPYVGFGRVVVKMVNGAYKYKVEFLCKVKFSEPSQEDSTKSEKLEFKTTELEGTIATLEDGTWSKSKTFDTQLEAITYLEGLMAASS